MNIFAIFSIPLGYVLQWCYLLVHNYGWAMLLFTLLTKAILFPLAIKQQRSTAEMAKFTPKLKEIQKKYANDKAKYNEEMLKLQKEEGYSPMKGCLPTLIQMPILFGLIGVIYRPMTYMLHISKDLITQAAGIVGIAANTNSTELTILSKAKEYADQLSFLPADAMNFNFNFLGMDLSQVPHLGVFNLLWLIPIVAGVSQGLTSWMAQHYQKLNFPEQAMNGAMGNSMIFLMPLMSVWFAFQLPAGIGLYWIFQSLFMVLQTWALNYFYNPKKYAEKLEAEAAAKRAEKAAKMGIPVTKITEIDSDEKLEQMKKSDKALQKELNRKRLAASRQQADTPAPPPPPQGGKPSKKKK